MCMDLLQEPCLGVSRHGSIYAEFMRWLRESVSELVDEVEAVDEFIRQNSLMYERPL
jgi:hypothetical protein